MADYTKFGSTQTLVYVSEAELNVLRTPGRPVIWTEADFDPNGALPLRFKPQGYTEAFVPSTRITVDGDVRITTASDTRITAGV